MIEGPIQSPSPEGGLQQAPKPQNKGRLPFARTTAALVTIINKARHLLRPENHDSEVHTPGVDHVKVGVPDKVRVEGPSKVEIKRPTAMRVESVGARFTPPQETEQSRRFRQFLETRAGDIMQELGSKFQPDGSIVALIPFGSTYAGIARPKTPQITRTVFNGSDLDLFAVTLGPAPEKTIMTLGDEPEVEIDVTPLKEFELVSRIGKPQDFNLLKLSLLFDGDAYVTSERDAFRLRQIRLNVLEKLLEDESRGRQIWEAAKEQFEVQVVTYGSTLNIPDTIRARAAKVFGQSEQEFIAERLHSFKFPTFDELKRKVKGK